MIKFSMLMQSFVHTLIYSNSVYGDDICHAQGFISESVTQRYKLHHKLHLVCKTYTL